MPPESLHPPLVPTCLGQEQVRAGGHDEPRHVSGQHSLETLIVRGQNDEEDDDDREDDEGEEEEEAPPAGVQGVYVTCI